MLTINEEEIMNLTLLKDYTTKASEGYLGATKLTGSKSHEYLSDAELSRNIKQALQAILAPELSKSDVKVKKESYSMGRSIYITLRLDKAKYAPTRDEYKANIAEEVKRDRYNWIKDGNGKDVFHEDYWKMNEEERLKAEEETAEQQAVWNYDREEHDINQYNLDREDLLNEEGRKIFEVANQVIKAYNYDDSNAQVDYFDTNFYYHLNVEWK